MSPTVYKVEVVFTYTPQRPDLVASYGDITICHGFLENNIEQCPK